MSKAHSDLDAISTTPVSIVRQVLVVDDTPANLVAAEAALESIECAIVKASSGVEALARLLEQDFAIVLLDVNMPGMDGFETARMIRARERSKHLPIVFITGFDQDDKALLRAYELGAVDFLFKPVHPEVLRAKVQFFVELQDHQQQVVALRLEREYEAKRRRDEAEAIAQQNAALAARDEAKDQFIAMLAREIRLPLAPVKHIVETLKSTNKVSLSAKMLSVLDRQLQLVDAMVEDLSELSRIGGEQRPFEAHDLRLLVERATIVSQPQLREKSHELTIKLAPDRVMVTCDFDQLVQAITSLVLNASRMTPDNGKIDIACIVNNRAALVIVADNGAGSSPTAGRGVGLALAQRLIAKHDGTLTVSSGGPDRGSTCVIQLPLLD